MSEIWGFAARHHLPTGYDRVVHCRGGTRATMGHKNDRKSTTLSISLTPELAAEVAARVHSGMYLSASELIREALRLLLEVERRSRSEARPEGRRLESALELHISSR